jgi:uncharacterized membrane protein
MHNLIFATLVLGIIAGLRAFTSITAIAWAAHLGYLPLEGTHLAFLGTTWCVAIFTLLAVFELVNDKLPKTPSRLVPPQFIGRVLLGAFAAAAAGFHFGNLWAGAGLGAVGAVLGTLGGAKARGGLAKIFGKDLPAALLEDFIAVCSAAMIVTHHL